MSQEQESQYKAVRARRRSRVPTHRDDGLPFAEPKRKSVPITIRGDIRCKGCKEQFQFGESVLLVEGSWGYVRFHEKCWPWTDGKLIETVPVRTKHAPGTGENRPAS